MNNDLENDGALQNENPEVSVVVVSYNTRDMTLQCLRALWERSRGVSMEVCVVDNASRDGSVEAIRHEFAQVSIIENLHNSGFGAANNAAMQQARGDFFLLLNSDAFVHEGAVQTLIEYAKSHAEIGVVGPRLLNADGTLQRSCYRFPGPARAWLENLWVSSVVPPTSRLGDYRSWAHDGELCVDWVIGACMLVRREVFEQVGGFDERFWMYAEETDWQENIARHGWKIAFVPNAVVTHLGGASGVDDKARINESFFDSLDFYEWKNYGAKGLVSMRLAMVLGGSLRLLLWSLAGFLPAKRKTARAKSRLQAWLTLRQLTRWNVSLKDKA